MESNGDAGAGTSGVQGSRGGSDSSGGPGGPSGLGSSGGLNRLGGLGGFNLGKGGLAGGGIGIAAILVFIVIRLLAGNSTPPAGGPLAVMLSQLASGAAPTGTVDSTALHCSTGTGTDDCTALTIVNSVQAYWSQQLARSGTTYTKAVAVFFSGSTPTACGATETGMGPFYCPSDQRIYIDVGFWSGLEKQFGAHDALFAQAFVLAREYGRHVQDLLGTNSRVSAGRGAGSLRLQLQADCYAGVWAEHAAAVAGPDGKILISTITSADVANAVDIAGRISDDYRPNRIDHSPVEASSLTQGSLAQRTKWFTTGYITGKPAACNTFDSLDLG